MWLPSFRINDSRVANINHPVNLHAALRAKRFQTHPKGATLNYEMLKAVEGCIWDLFRFKGAACSTAKGERRQSHASGILFRFKSFQPQEFDLESENRGSTSEKIFKNESKCTDNADLVSSLQSRERVFRSEGKLGISKSTKYQKSRRNLNNRRIARGKWVYSA